METNVVVARFTGYATVTDMRYRWDYGQKLKVEGIADLPDYFEVHFSNAPSVGTAKVWLGQNGVVDIPDEYLATGEPVYAWIFLHAGETDGETVYSILIPVKKRPKPVNDAPTPVQKSELDTAIAILQTAAATATEQATIATGAATTATEAAETATSAVADVEAAATRAEQAAEGAEASATDAQAAARSAELSAQTAQLAKSAAETAAANAEQSATDAGNYAGLAEAAEQDAQAAKTAAEASATAAAASETAAQTAQTAAEAAKDTAVANATTATTKAAEAAQSASSAADSETAAEAAATRAEQAAASLTVDSALSETSENPVQNKVVTGAVADLKSALTYKADAIYGGTPTASYLTLTAGESWTIGTGGIATNSKRARSDKLSVSNSRIVFSAKDGYSFVLNGNNSETPAPLTRITSDWQTFYEIVPINYKYLYVIVMKGNGSSDVSQEEVSDALLCTVYDTVEPYAMEKDLNSFEEKVDDALKVGTYGTDVSFTRHDTGYINPSNGNIVAATNDVAYTKISVNPGESYLISAYFTSNIGIAFYKADNTFISGSGISSDTIGTNNIVKMPVKVPQNAYVMGVSTRYQSTSPIGIQKSEPLYGKMRESANAIEETATGDFVIIDDANVLPVNEIVSTISNASSGTIIVSGKNLMPQFVPGTSKGVTFTVNDDGSVTASGTSDANNAYVGVNFPASLIKMLKGLRICVSGGGDSSSYIQLEVKVPGSTYYRTTEAKGYFTYVVPEATTSIYASVNVRNSGTTINKTFYPQIEILTEYPLGYEKSNVKLYTADWNTEAGTITSGSVNLTTGEVISGNDSYEIDPIEVVLNYGRNYIFSDCGNVTVQYRADTTLYETTDVISKMPEYVQKNLAIKHIGQLSKPYLCLTSDDGEEELATYTIPMVISKGVPMTFAIWGTSEVMRDPAYLAIVKDAVDNHGCEIAQHGRDAWVQGEQWDGLVPTEQQLYEFFEAEKAVFENAGLTVKGCACPYGYVNPRLMAQCGGYFNVFRTTNYYTEGYNVFYDHACCGPRTNMYGLYSRGITAYSTEQWIENIDYAIAHNYLIVLYIHDANLSAEDKVTLETMIDYAKAHGVTFCNLGDIPFIT